MSYSTAINKITVKGARAFGKYSIVGRIPASCYDKARGASMIYETEELALTAILNDPWIKANPEQRIQLADCSVYDRAKPDAGHFTVKLASRGNPDYGQNPERPVHGVRDRVVKVNTLLEARDLCRKFISDYNLGGGNWTGGEVKKADDGEVVGYFSYNGRLWKDKKCTAEVKI